MKLPAGPSAPSPAPQWRYPARLRLHFNQTLTTSHFQIVCSSYLSLSLASSWWKQAEGLTCLKGCIHFIKIYAWFVCMQPFRMTYRSRLHGRGLAPIKLLLFLFSLQRFSRMQKLEKFFKPKGNIAKESKFTGIPLGWSNNLIGL